jgi:hypothetical protein
MLHINFSIEIYRYHISIYITIVYMEKVYIKFLIFSKIDYNKNIIDNKKIGENVWMRKNITK